MLRDPFQREFRYQGLSVLQLQHHCFGQPSCWNTPILEIFSYEFTQTILNVIIFHEPINNVVHHAALDTNIIF